MNIFSSPLMNSLVIIGFVSFIVYLCYLIVFHLGLKKKNFKNYYFSSDKPINYVKLPVSVIVAARNEEANIGNLLTGLINQSYPTNLYEVIIVNDRSTDGTEVIVGKFTSIHKNIKIINIKETPENFSPKKYALSMAIESAVGEIIVLTDADCLVGKYWIESMVSHFSENIDMVAGFSRTKIKNWRKADLLSKYEFFDFLVIFIAAAGAVLKGKAFSCSNQNLAYRRSSYFKVGGFEKIKHIVSGDDVNLMQLFRKARMGIDFSLIPHSFVYTKPILSTMPETKFLYGWLRFISQRSRWASNSKWQLLLNPEFFVYLCSVFLLNLTVLFMLFVNWKVAIGLLIIKLLAEYLFISAHFNKFETDKKRLLFSPVWAIIQPVYILLVAMLGLFDVFVWKKNP